MNTNAKQPLRGVSHPALLALDGCTVRIETRTAADGGTCVWLHDPNTGVLLATIGLTDDGAAVRAHCAIRCTAREQGASYRRKGER